MSRRKRPTSRRLAAAAVASLGLLTSACGGDDGPPLERALRLVEDEGEFGTALESGDTFAHVAELLLDAGESAASAWVQVAAVEVLECSLPEIHDVRQSVRELLAAPTELPALPSC